MNFKIQSFFFDSHLQIKFLLIPVFLLVLFFPIYYGLSITITPIYSDPPKTGFNDETLLSDLEKQTLASTHNNANTLGEARKNALEHALGIIGKKFQSGNVVTVEVRFSSLDNEQTIAVSSPYIVSVGSSRFPGIFYPCALAETIGIIRRQCEQAFNITADFAITFSDEVFNFYYGLDGNPLSNTIDFVPVVMHEVFHGMGFDSAVMQGGSFRLTTPGTGNRIPIKMIYDMQVYSQLDKNFFLQISDAQRSKSLVSEMKLSWDGTSENVNHCSYARRISELRSSGIDSNGRPLLFTPDTFDKGASYVHVSPDIGDIMKSDYPISRDMYISLGMLRDMGWEINDSEFPPSCDPTGITVNTPTLGTEGQGVFTVELDSEPMSNVSIPVTSSDLSEINISPATLVFTPADWASPKEITVTASNSRQNTGVQAYSVEFGEIITNDRFYSRLPKPADVSVKIGVVNRRPDPDPPTNPSNDGTGPAEDETPDPDPPTNPSNDGTGPAEDETPDPDPPINPLNDGTESTEGGCSISGENRVQASFLLNTFYPIILLVFFLLTRLKHFEAKF